MGSSAAATAFILAVATFVAVLTFSATVASAADLPPYTNHTVGGDVGWIYNQATKAPATDYTAWATNQSFFLGDYLIFKTNGNSTVIQTYNATTYKNCSPDEDGSPLNSVYGGGDADGGVSAVPLTREGDTYYLSGTFDGAQCQDGMKFQIKVGKGSGLPAYLNQPPPPPYVAPGPPQQQAAADATPSAQQGSSQGNGAGGVRNRLGPLGLAVSVMGLLVVVV